MPYLFILTIKNEQLINQLGITTVANCSNKHI